MTTHFHLSTTGVKVPASFPFKSYEIVHSIVATRHGQHALYEHFGGAWNGLGYRYRACLDSGELFLSLIRKFGSTPEPEERYLQERALFDFFSNGFSTFECSFYALYTLGAIIDPAAFPLSTERDQQKVTPTKTRDEFAKTFRSDVILQTFVALFSDPDYQKWREVRNILTHRSAPGRKIYVSIGDEGDLPTEWKLNGAVFDGSIVTAGKERLDRMLASLVDATAHFVTAKFT